MESVMCGDGFSTFFNSTVMPFTIYAGIITATIIAISFMIGRFLSNPKLTLWAKTELLQLFVSLGTVFVLTTMVSMVCNVSISEIADIFEVPNPGGGNVYDAAYQYLHDAALYSHNAITVTRYHLEAYTILSYFNAFICDYPIGRIGLGCFFGYSGDNQQPFGGYGAQIAALNMAFNSSIIAHFTALNFFFILQYAYNGFAFLFLPLGVFLRAMPYMRSFGSLLISLAVAFLLVYPLILGIFYIMSDKLLDADNDYAPSGIDMGKYSETIFASEEDAGSQLSASTLGEDYVKDTYLPSGTNDVPGALEFAAVAFIAAVFFPTIAMLATIASISYIARLYGDEIDLSRITQLV